MNFQETLHRHGLELTRAATTTGYGIEFCSSIWRDNIVATQFHPEKSQEVGLRMLKNFGEMT